MPKTKISEFSVTPGDNTDIDGINIAEGCAPSGINDAIRELMAQLKDFQSGAAGDNITVVGTLAAKGTSASGADLKLYEDTDNGTNYVGFIAPASIASNVQWTLPSADGSSGQALQTNGSGTLSFATLGISAGGTGQTTANAAFNALAPSQTSNAGRYLKTDGTNTSWDLLDISTADITGTLPVANGGTGITSFGTGVATALGINVGSSGAFVTNGGALGTPSSGTVTNLTGTASININGTVGATTPNTGSFTTLTTSSTVTINGGTANGVAYLNGSKVLTTGSALVFDGSNLGIGVTPAAWSGVRGLDVGSGANIAVASNSGGAYLTLNSYYNGASWIYKTTAAASYYAQVGGEHLWYNAGSGTAGNAITFTQAMTLGTTGNLGIGTSSPGAKLDVAGTFNGTQAVFGNTPGRGLLIGTALNGGVNEGSTVLNARGAGNGQFLLQTDGTTRLTISDAGNLGLGVTPSAWGTGFQSVIETKNIGVLAAAGPYVSVMANAYYNSSNQYIYKTSAQATHYAQALGQHQWFTAGSGTAGNTISFTQAMTLDASGNLLVGTTTATEKFSLVQSGANGAGIQLSQTGTGGRDYRISSTGTGYGSAGNLIFYDATAAAERARITSGGYSKFSNDGTYVNSTSAYHEMRQTANDTGVAISATNGSYAANLINCIVSRAATNAYNFIRGEANGVVQFYMQGNGGLANYSANDINLSDRREKTNFAPAKSYLDSICAIPVQTFNYIGQSEDDPGLTLGVVAQDVQAVAPELVTESNWGTEDNPKMRLSIYQTDLQYALMKCIQELKAQNDDLRARVAQLEAK